MDGSSSARAEILRGIAGAPGVAIGTAVVMGSARNTYPRRHIHDDEAAAELVRFGEAVERVRQNLREMTDRLGDKPSEAAILEAYAAMVGDEVLLEGVRKQIHIEKRCAEWAVVAACADIARRIAAVDDPYLRERSHDVEFVGERVLRALMSAAGVDATIPKLSGRSVLIGHDLSPADTAGLVTEPVVAFVTEMGTRTSHTSIMARALEIPAVVGVTDALARIASGDIIIVDGLRGVVIVDPTPEQLDDAKSRSERYTAFSRELQESRDRPPATLDGTRITLRANVELPAEAILARDYGAEGIGLYRTEFLYIDRLSPPNEDEQFEVFRAVVEAIRPRPVVLRTFDIGGDKFVSTFQLPPEMNPMLGLRAIRLALSRPEVFMEQLRAMLRASAYGDVRIMIPMVASLTELRETKRLLEQARAQVKARGQPMAEHIPLGVMIEVPSAALMVDKFAQEAAFLSLGTNDLIQYALAVDRTARNLAYLASPFDPSILRLVSSVVRAGMLYNCPVSICGAAASDPLCATLLLGLGLRDFSMESAAIPEIKEAFRRVKISEAEAMAEEALACTTADEVEHCVAGVLATKFYDLLTGER
ncbi:MAG: phosphoenolpyruvate--protein phosphotransferase [Polyangiaceae bacterium]|nr:phosphoenolpyruvate--protein phosphotransferase [Polyangiaceae bacterium]